VVYTSQSPLPVPHSPTACYCTRRFCWNAVVKGGDIIQTTRPPSTAIDRTYHGWNGCPSPRVLFVFDQCTRLARANISAIGSWKCTGRCRKKSCE
jgi:hypothetical protein